MVKLKQAIVVEGKYDKNTLSQLVDTAIFTTDGFGGMNDKTFLSFLRSVAQARGLIVLTDSDGAGFVIRNRLKSALPKQGVLHAYIPDIYGKEKRKTAPGKEGKLGVEGMDGAVLLQALEQAGATFEDGSAPSPKEPLTKLDLYELGLSGHSDSKEKRLQLLKKLNFPEHMSANALLEALNILYGREEFLSYYEETL
ncbi:MAG: DUF4093 domain-containing protein [Oscillospiraceae bacterium]|nr:DUF4093 domain-containing protein [Oscillospiraceae bacterium]